MTEKVKKISDFVERFKSVILSTIDKDGSPYASYAPFVRYEGTYYLIVSANAEHYINIKNNPKIGLLFVEDESKSSSIFFRNRLSYKAITETVIPDEALKSFFKERLGNLVTQLFKMDFVVVKIKLKSGIYIVGPGKAFNVNEKEEILEQIGLSGGHGRR